VHHRPAQAKGGLKPMNSMITTGHRKALPSQLSTACKTRASCAFCTWCGVPNMTQIFNFFLLIFSLISTQISSDIDEESKSMAKFTLEHNIQIIYRLTRSKVTAKSTYSGTYS
jgi:hypothetical protein